jgi:predicted nucleic acid-binding protein
MVAANRADDALHDFLDLRLTRYPHFVLLPRIWELRHSSSAYDAAYVALAELLAAPLLTRGKKMASAAAHYAVVEVI